MTIDELIQERPWLHRHGDGAKANWGIKEGVLKFIDRQVKAGTRTIETGGGISTVAFALKDCEHYTIFPEPYLQETISEYLREKQIPLTKIHFLLGYSQRILPVMREEDFDVALIDGEHAFPTPMMDWYYLAPKLKVGGILIIDDTQIWTGRILKTFLRLEPEWRLVEELYGTAIFEMMQPWQEKWWGLQAFTVYQSDLRAEDLQFIPEHIIRSMSPVFHRK